MVYSMNSLYCPIDRAWFAIFTTVSQGIYLYRYKTKHRFFNLNKSDISYFI